MMNLYRKISLKIKKAWSSKLFKALLFYYGARIPRSSDAGMSAQGGSATGGKVICIGGAETARKKPTLIPHILLWGGAYFLAYIILLYPTRHGVGQFWDWTFPYFSEHIPNLFSNRSLSWTDLDFGKPLDYSTDYILRFFISLFSFINPETLRFFLNVVVFTLSSFGVFLIANKKVNSVWSFILGLVALINPAIFYKFVAGHFNYFVSYLIFIYVIYYLLFKFGKNLKSAVVVGLFLSFIGIQIQFFFLGFFFLFLFFCFERKKFKLKYFIVICSMVLLVNSVWLSNFIFKGSDIAKISTNAAKVSVVGSKGTDLFNILDFSFSKATLIDRLYGNQYLVFFVLFYMFLFLFLLKGKLKDKTEILFFVFLIILTILGTGIYNSFQIWPISIVYPMFREVGHFAPLIILLLVLSVSRVIKNSKVPNFLFFCFMIVFLSINFYKFYQYAPAINFSDIRRSFDEFNKNNNSDNSTYRILSYPFFDQYSLRSNSAKVIDNFLVNNSGHDSFMTFSGKEFANNAVPPHQFKDSMQYKLLKSDNVELLRPYNIKYIYDFSNIYESNYNNYVPDHVYDRDLSLIKNDPEFFDKLIAQNPGKLDKVSDNILEIRDYKPRIYPMKNIFEFTSLNNLESKTDFTRSVLEKDYGYTVADDAKKAPTILVASLFDGIGEDNIDYAHRLVFDDKAYLEDGKALLYVNNSKSYIYAEKKDKSLGFYKKVSGGLRLNGGRIGQGSQELIKEIKIDPAKKYYIGWGAQLTEVKEEAELDLGIIDKDTIFRLYSKDNQNLIPNASFQDGLWDKTVGDCDKYDGNPILDMKLGEKKEAGFTENGFNGAGSLDSADDKFLQLEATKHTACTTNKFDIREFTDYLFSFDYQSPNAKTAGYYLEFNDPDKTMVKEQIFINDASWHAYSKRIRSPIGATSARLYLYAYSSDEKTDIVNRYDNFFLVRLESENEVGIDYNPEFEKQEISLDKNSVFEYADAYYDYANIIPNASFEDGLWQGKVGDCNNYDDDPEIAMSLADDDSSDGAKSLRLESIRHNACASAAFPVKENSNYLFGFDYQSPNAKAAGYYLEFNDNLRTVSREILRIKDENWQSFTREIKAPAGATSARLYAYSYETDKKTSMITRYDNFKFIELPKLDDKYYLVSDSGSDLENPEKVDFETVNSTKKIVRIKSAKTPFFLAMSESYHPEWRLVMDNEKMQGVLASWTPFVNPDKVSDEDHFQLGNFMNAWYVDINDLCKAEDLCRSNSDGSYDLDMIIEFAPQRWFNVSLLVSILTLLGSSGYLVWGRVRKRNIL